MFSCQHGVFSAAAEIIFIFNFFSSPPTSPNRPFHFLPASVSPQSPPPLSIILAKRNKHAATYTALNCAVQVDIDIEQVLEARTCTAVFTFVHCHAVSENVLAGSLAEGKHAPSTALSSPQCACIHMGSGVTFFLYLWSLKAKCPYIRTVIKAFFFL